jgi:hypothetical protein
VTWRKTQRLRMCLQPLNQWYIILRTIKH